MEELIKHGGGVLVSGSAGRVIALDFGERPHWFGPLRRYCRQFLPVYH